MTYFHFGNLTIPAVWLAAPLALFIASLLHRTIAGNKVGDWYWNGFFLYFVVWKLSYILFNLNMFLDMPLSVLYFNGGTKGHILALAALSFYLLVIAVKKHPGVYKESTVIFLLYFMIYEVLISLLEKNKLEATVHLLILIGYVFFLYYLKKNGRSLANQMVILIMMVELLTFSIFNSFLSLEALTFVWIGLTMIIIHSNIIRRYEKHE